MKQDNTMDFQTLERYRSLVGDWDAFTEALSRPQPVCVWTNTLKTTPEALAKTLAEHGCASTPIPWYPRGFTLPENISPGNRFEYVAGLYHVQEETSMLPVVLLDPQPGERIIDLCAAPGNKAVQIAVHMESTGTLIANDRNYRRVRAIGHAFERLGVYNVSTTTFDATSYPVSAGVFDRVLADVPCSCEGTSRKHPEVLDPSRRPGSNATVQKAILKKAIQLCRPGGRVVYSTCTYAPEENEMIVQSILDENPPGSLKMLPAVIPGFVSSPGLLSWQEHTFAPQMENAMRVYPHQNDTGGFFVAVIEKAA